MNENGEVKNLDRFKILYPNVTEPLPLCWSSTEKNNSIGLSNGNLRVHYKGVGKSHNDAASVRTNCPIPASCGLYYFEVKIISKGRDGYMGIGLTASSASSFKMNRLPGWDKQSYGYHGDDGNSFCSSGNGQPYGPTFTTGDVIGCGVNLVDNTCFYTKNGHHLGIAFRDLPAKLYPTVGLQTPGEIVDANFGQKPFEFDIEDMIKELRASTKAAIYTFPLPEDQSDWTVIMQKMVLSYLVHHGYSSTAEKFSDVTGQNFAEDINNIKTRQKILKLVQMGRIGQAIELTNKCFSGLLDSNQNLLFMLKCRQFVEMVNGSDLDTSSHPSVIQSTKHYQPDLLDQTFSNDNQNYSIFNEEINTPNQQQSFKFKRINDYIENHYHDSNSEDIDMDENGGYNNNSKASIDNTNDDSDDMDVDVSPISNKSIKSGIERMLELGRELLQMSLRLEKKYQNVNDEIIAENRKMMEEAFSLLAYSNPWASPVGKQLSPSKREPICAKLNSAILESMNYPTRPPLELCLAHTRQLMTEMSDNSLGSCAFVNMDEIIG
ncbi:unnamed protein product [Chironomus riparius]|uniref:Ran-binding protein 9 n=1 Tax=Chironomus riparius TaxID=315576 RepID=A0A9N9RLL0_9DIPT|nr:unnamed protein product [Chironomus riparius]